MEKHNILNLPVLLILTATKREKTCIFEWLLVLAHVRLTRNRKRSESALPHLIIYACALHNTSFGLFRKPMIILTVTSVYKHFRFVGLTYFLAFFPILFPLQRKSLYCTSRRKDSKKWQKIVILFDGNLKRQNQKTKCLNCTLRILSSSLETIPGRHKLHIHLRFIQSAPNQYTILLAFAFRIQRPLFQMFITQNPTCLCRDDDDGICITVLLLVLLLLASSPFVVIKEM